MSGHPWSLPNTARPHPCVHCFCMTVDHRGYQSPTGDHAQCCMCGTRKLKFGDGWRKRR